MVAVPAGPPPPSVPEGWKAHWNADYKAWFYENIYTEESTWEKPTEPGYTPTVQQNTEEVKSADPTTLPQPMAAMTLGDGSPSYNQSQAQPPASGYAPQPQPTQQPANQGLYPTTPPQGFPAQPAQQGANPIADTRDIQGQQQPAPQQPAYGYAPQEQERGQSPGYPQQQQQPGYPPQQPSYPPQQPSYPPQQPGYPPQQPGYPPQQPGYPPQQQPGYPPQQPGYPPQQPGYPPQQQPGYPPQQQPGYPPQQAMPGQPIGAPQGPPQQAPGGGGFMDKLNSKVGNKVPGGAGTLLGVGTGLLGGAVLAHEWNEHEDRERRHRGFGGFGGLMRGFGGETVTENVTVDTTYQTTDTFNF